MTKPSATAAALLWATRSAPVLRGLTHRFGNGLHALSLVSGGQDNGLAPEDVLLLRGELLGFERLTEQYRTLALALEEEPSAGRVEDALAVAVGLRAAHVAVRVPEMSPVLDGDTPAILAPPVALAQSILILLLGDTPDATESPTVYLRGSDVGVELEMRGAHLRGEDADAEAAVMWLLRAVKPAAEISWRREGNETTVCLSLPSLRASRRAAADPV